MAFTMGGLFIKAQIENGEQTFGLSANNAFVNSIESINLKMMLGGVSEMSISITPTFAQAVEIIETGILGYGFPMEKQQGKSNPATITKGVVDPIAGAKPFGNTAVSLSMQIGYTDDSSTAGNKVKTPWFSGLITAPNLSFGQEIRATINATAGIGRTLLDTCKDRSFKKKSLKDIVEQIVKDDCGGKVVYLDSDVANELKKIIISVNQDDNSLAFVKGLLERYGFYYYMSGGDDSGKKESLVISTLRAQNSKKPAVTLRMYGQIDVNNGVYPIEEFETDISHTFVTGAARKSQAEALNTETKESLKKNFSSKEHGDKNKILGKTADLDDGSGRPTEGGVSSGFPSGGADKTNKKFVALAKEENDDAYIRAVESESQDKQQRAFVLNVRSIFIPEIVPGHLVNVEIYTGNPDYPLFTKVSGVYRAIEVEHTIGTNGGNSMIKLVREIGIVLAENKTQTVKPSTPRPSPTIAMPKEVRKGVIT